jgi:hypothetical protein
VKFARDDVAEVGGLAGLPPSKGLPNSDHRNRLTVTASRCAALATSLSGECVSSCLPSSLARGLAIDSPFAPRHSLITRTDRRGAQVEGQSEYVVLLRASSSARFLPEEGQELTIAPMPQSPDGARVRLRRGGQTKASQPLFHANC